MTLNDTFGAAEIHAIKVDRVVQIENHSKKQNANIKV